MFWEAVRRTARRSSLIAPCSFHEFTIDDANSVSNSTSRCIEPCEERDRPTGGRKATPRPKTS